MRIRRKRFSKEDLETLIRLNDLRAVDSSSAERKNLEDRFALHYATENNLAVYGTLAPGCPNHHQLNALKGIWHSGYTVRGELEQRGWGADVGYPALCWSESAGSIAIQLFISADLPNHWARLDDFEGPEYLRILVPVHSPQGVVAVANIYAARAAAHTV